MNTSAALPLRRKKAIITVLIALLLFGTALLFGTGNLTRIVNLPGLFGTQATLFSDLNLIAQFIMLVGLFIGFLFARGGNIQAHQYMQTAMVLFSIVLTIFVMIVGYIDYVIPGMPENLRTAYGIVTTIHGVLGLLAILCGVYLLLLMNRLLPKRYRIPWWRNLMRLTLGLYWFVGIWGLGVYYVWYIL